MTCTNADVIIIRGAPGCGKTQTSKCLASHFPKGVRAEVDALRGMVISVDWTNQSEHTNVLSLSTGLVVGFLRLGYKPVIVVDTFSGDKLAHFLSELRSLNSALDVRAFALVTAPGILRLRVENRPGDHFRDFDVCAKLNEDVLKYLQPCELVIDNTKLTPEETAQVILGLRPSTACTINDCERRNLIGTVAALASYNG